MKVPEDAFAVHAYQVRNNMLERGGMDLTPE